ncbi:MAG: S8 family peptidase, partial [Hydrogenophaga sp.]|nr:S8 family peptidase [Hydrogenophaga sp.]
MNKGRLFKAGALASLVLSVLVHPTLSMVHAAENAFQTKTFSKAASSRVQVKGIIIKYRQGAGVTKGLGAQYAGQNAAGLGFAKASEAANRRGVSLLFDKSLVTGGHLLRLSAALPPDQLRQMIEEIAKDPAVEYAEPDSIRRAALAPNDPYYSYQWHLQAATGGIQMPAAWDLATGNGVRVAYVDTGSTSHPDLTPNLIGGYDFISDPWTANDGNGRDSDPSDAGDGVTAYESYWYCGDAYQEFPASWHGTGVAGIVGALTNNGVGVSSVAFGAKVVPVRVLGRCGGLVSDIAEGAIWAAGGAVPGVPANPYPAKVINLSLAYRDACSATEQAAIDTIRGLGAVVVVAAGNHSESSTLYAPANCRGVITVGATAANGGKADFSNFGATVGLSAPGVSVLSTANFGYWTPGTADYGYWDGTSMSAPQVAGVAALMLQQNPGLTPDQVAA